MLELMVNGQQSTYPELAPHVHSQRHVSMGSSEHRSPCAAPTHHRARDDRVAQRAAPLVRQGAVSAGFTRCVIISVCIAYRVCVDWPMQMAPAARRASTTGALKASLTSSLCRRWHWYQCS